MHLWRPWARFPSHFKFKPLPSSLFGPHSFNSHFQLPHFHSPTPPPSIPNMASSKKPSSRSRPRAISYDSLYLNPLPPNSPASARPRPLPRSRSVVAYCGKENAVPFLGCGTSKSNPLPSPIPHKPRLKPSSLQLCIQRTEPDSSFGSALLLAEDDEGNGRSRSENAWDYSDSEAAPASGWSTLPNRCSALSLSRSNHDTDLYLPIFLFFTCH